jgi:phenylpropionate dioxygenase-like ring-hydroxylating dioxygenase large terminal subunit
MGDMPFTRRYPFLTTGPVSTEPYISPRYLEGERDRIFAREWLLLCRVEMLPKPGDFVVRDVEICDVSVLIVHGEDGKIRAFHNVCSHRGMRLQEVRQGSNPSFVCRYHGWIYALDGGLRRATAREHFPNDMDAATCGLTPVHMDIWNGFIFVNLAKTPPHSLQEFLGGYGDFASGFPFHKADAVATMGCELKSNWKAAVDAFQEFYHAVFLHMRTQRNMYYTLDDRSGRLRSLDLYGPHRRYSAAVNPDYKTPEHAHVEKLVGKYVHNVNAGALGGKEGSIYDVCPGLNPTRDPYWSWDQTFIFPNSILTLLPGMWVMSQFWPISLDRCRWETLTCTPKPQKASERFAREYGFAHSLDVAAEDLGTTEGTMRGMLSRAKPSLMLQDNEVAIRHMLYTVDQYLQGASGRAPGAQ